MNTFALANRQISHKNKMINIYGENIKIKSKFIKTVCYHPLSSVLEVFFKSNAHYVYLNVSPKIYAEFMHSRSKGKAYNKLIKGKFKDLKLTEKE
jgi:hypothetical protein